MSALGLTAGLLVVVSQSGKTPAGSAPSKLAKFWNQLLTKYRGKIKDPMSYSNKMKYSVSLVELMVAEVNNRNRQYLKEFRQGKQPGGEPRTLKVMINDKDLDNFVIYRKVI